jgi:hypothetical protein
VICRTKEEGGMGLFREYPLGLSGLTVCRKVDTIEDSFCGEPGDVTETQAVVDWESPSESAS